MSDKAILNTVMVLCAGVLLASCGDRATPATALEDAEATNSARSPARQLATADLVGPPMEPFTIRAPIQPYFINQAPDLMIRSTVTADLAIQRLLTDPTVGAWHSHPGPSFAIVERGRVMITRFTRKGGCIATVYGPDEAAGKTYYEVGGEVHRATVLGPHTAIEYKVRFNTPVGAPFAAPADDPDC